MLLCDLCDRLKKAVNLLNAHLPEVSLECVPTQHVPVQEGQCGCEDDPDSCSQSPSPALIVTPTAAPVYITGATYKCVSSKRFVILYRHTDKPV